ncbi:MAG: hypothetical protein BZY88_10420 [SAR202 cluster bacterium Io17-Chloro-G9]|nr:MAG: hypothetical protein BZY88_10420 [SAR202 cluster bacterium Io17-Chloro-G9]
MLTALVGIPILVTAIWWSGPWLSVLVALTAVFGIRELYRMLPAGAGPLPAELGALWCVALVMGGQASTDTSSFLRITAVIWLAGAFVAMLWLFALHPGRRHVVAGIYLLGGPLYIGFLLAHSLALREAGGTEDLGRNWLLLALAVAFANDTGAYLVGRSLGAHSMAPSISPNKTWEGSVGGLAFAIAASLALGRILDLEILIWQQAVIGSAVGVLGQMGDLAESKLKRIANMKDAGSIIPGHGGVLDRLDSIVVSVPTVYYLVAVVFEP